jgi:hypothetical protein
VFDAVIGKFEQLEESVDDRQREIVGDLARTYNQNLGKLKAKFDEIKKDVLTSWFEKAWNKIKAVVNAIVEFASRIAELLGRLAHLVGDIVTSPRYFFSNLVSGIGQGFSTFVGRIGEFLATAFFDWLRGSSGVAIQMPKDLGPKGIFSLFTQLLNLGVETIWERMEIVYDKTIAAAFRRGEVLLGRGLEIFRIVKEEGLSGLWDEIKTSLGSMLDEALETIKENVLYAAIKKAILEIGKMLVPGGGFIAIAEKVIRLLQFLVEARNKILDLIAAFVDSVEMAVKGNVGGIVKHITGALTKFITLALDFLVRFFGLGDIKGKVTGFIEKMRQPVVRGIDWVLNKLKPLVMKAKSGKPRGKEEIADKPPHVSVRRDLLQALRAELTSEHSLQEAQVIVTNIGERFKPLGVRRITVGARNEAGESPIILEMSPGEEVAYLSPGAELEKELTVRLNVEFTLTPAVSETSLLRSEEKGKRSYKDLPAVSALATTRTRTGKPFGGIIFPESGGKIQLITWNTSPLKFDKRGNESHAEKQFHDWLEKLSYTDEGKILLDRVVKVEMHLRDYSPCGDCGDLFRGIAAMVPNAKEKLLYWYKLYKGKSPTSYGTLAAIHDANWKLHAPGTEMPAGRPSVPVYLVYKLRSK